MMFVRKNRLGMALTLESHLAELKKDIRDGKLFSSHGQKPVKRIGKLEDSCYVCRRIEFNFGHMVETAVLLWESDPEFKVKHAAQPYFCLPHYKRLLATASGRLDKKQFNEFERVTSSIVNTYLDELEGDVSWFCKKFDYRYDAEPWYNSKDAVERSIRFLRSDLHRPPENKKKSNY